MLLYRTKVEQAEFAEKCQPNIGCHFNKAFNSFVRGNAHNKTRYLYLTAGNTKCGAFVRYFGSTGMKYEIVPNLLCDDDTLNIRIPLDEINTQRLDVQFLFAKYHNTYSIYGIPFTSIGGALIFPPKYRKLWYDLKFWMPPGKESMIFSIVETIRMSCSATDDYDLYKKSLSKIVRLLSKNNEQTFPNQFSDILLPYPSDIGQIEVYKQAKQRYKETMQKYEADTLGCMADLGFAISRWKNEADLFNIVKKAYPDAIYQYHSEWLNLQSLDVFIPSLNIAIEYQGEQHYRPIDFFGGEPAFQSVVERDARKADLCSRNGIRLIYWRYDEAISSNRLKKKIAEI